jgi:hypothetical protein
MQLLNVNILIGDHLMYQAVQPGSNLRPDKDTPQEEQVSGLHRFL